MIYLFHKLFSHLTKTKMLMLQIENYNKIGRRKIVKEHSWGESNISFLLLIFSKRVQCGQVYPLLLFFQYYTYVQL